MSGNDQTLYYPIISPPTSNLPMKFVLTSTELLKTDTTIKTETTNIKTETTKSASIPIPGTRTLRLVRKDKNSPLLSIQTFISPYLTLGESIDISNLWSKYSVNENHSLIIKEHKLDYDLFKEIVSMLIEIRDPFNSKSSEKGLKAPKQITQEDLIELKL